MCLSLTFIAVYLLGGLTFLPGLLLFILLHAYFVFPTSNSISISEKAATHPLRDNQDDGQNIQSRSGASGLAEKFHRRHESDVAAGYFAVCREYVPGGINGKPPERTTPVGAVVALESPSVYQSMYRSLFDRKQGPSLDSAKVNGKTAKRARNVFFVVLRHGHLMLYEDSEQMEVKHVISLELHDVGIYSGEELIPEGELWIKRNAIRLSRKLEDPASTSKPFFFFSENCSEKEDFYFALLQNQDVKADALDNPPRPQQYETSHMIGLVQKLHSSEEYMQSRWINGLVGRLFLALYKTRTMEDFVRKKIIKKIARVKKPAFLSEIVLQKIDMGDSAPQISNPRLKDLTIDGDCCAEADFKYSGSFRLEIKANARIDLGTRFKAREFNLVLAVVVKKLSGHGLMKVKPPPSNRIWISFETMPEMEMAIEPIVSSRQITYGIILRAIESRIREVVAETVVLPHWDDSPFTDTSTQKFRGGIWIGDNITAHSQPQHTKIPDEAPEDEADNDVEIGSASIAHGLAQTKDNRVISMPDLPGASPSILVPKVATNQMQGIQNPSREGMSTGLQKREDPPKAMRSRSFAAAANPLLSMDTARIDSTQMEHNRKSQKDAASIIKAISSKSPATSPSETPDGLAITAPTLWENSKSPDGTSSLLFDTEDFSEKQPLPTATESSSQASLSSTTTSVSSLSAKPAIADNVPQPQGLGREVLHPIPLEKRQSMATLGAATAAAKNWGWGVFGRSLDQRNSNHLNQDRAGIPSQPVGRGQPLPPPGQPLPFPEGARSKAKFVNTTRRKSVIPLNQFERKQDEVKVRAETPPPLPVRKRQAQDTVDHASDEGLLVVEAPPDSEPSSPVNEESPKSSTSLTAERGENPGFSSVGNFSGVIDHDRYSTSEKPHGEEFFQSA